MTRKLALGLVIALTHLATAQAETLTGRNIDTRFMLAFAVDGDQFGGMLPDGWSAIGFPSGPFKGANLLVGLEERHLAMTSDGQPADPTRSRAAAIMTLAKGEDGVRLYILKVLTSDPGYDLYPEATTAKITRESNFWGADSGSRQTEAWSFATESGHLEIALEFEAGTGSWTSNDARPYSASDPGLSWIFRYEQLVDLVMSSPIGKPFSGDLTISTDLPEIAGILGGGETLVGILSIPVYIREVFAP